MRPDDGMLVAALRHRGADLLAERPGPWTGCPLLHPWANRLSTDRFELRGREVDASGAQRDENGVLLHGLPSHRWQVQQADRARIRGRLHWDDDAFPFPHQVVVEHRLSAVGLETVTEVTGDTPVAFGWHPFLRLPGVARERWRVTLGSCRRVALDECVELIQAMRDAAVAINPDVIVLCHGGPLAEPEDAQYVLDRTEGVVGFFGASSMERLPTEVAMTENMRRFKALAHA